MKLRLGYPAGSLLIAITLGTTLGMADVVLLSDGRHIQGREFEFPTQKVVPVSPFSPFDAFIQGFPGSARQTSLITVSDGSMHGFSGMLGATSGGRLLEDFTSVFDLTFHLQEARFYSTDVGVTGRQEGASAGYQLELTGVFLQGGSLGNQVVNFSNSGVLDAGDYRFTLLIDAFHADQDFPVSSDIAANLSFNLTPVSVPEGGSTIVMLGIALPLIALFRFWVSRKSEQISGRTSGR